MGLKDWKIDNSWTLFLDRDGVINQRDFNGYILTYDNFHFENEVLIALKKSKYIFGRIIVVTNQQCVGLELITISELNEIHNKMKGFIQINEGKVDAVFSAINLKNDVVSRRKPNPSMALEAKNIFPEIDFNKSIMVGDTDADLLFGENLGMKTVLIESQEKVNRVPDIRVKSLNEFIELI